MGRSTTLFPNSSGLTLIELVTSLAIMVLLTGLLVPAFRTFGARNVLNQGAQDLAQGITQAKAYALAPRAQAPVGTTDYRVEINDDETYLIREVVAGTPNTIKSGTLPSGLVFTSLPRNPVVLQFGIVSQGAVSLMVPDSAELTIRIQSTRNNEEKSVIFTKATGTVRVE
jgi:Tfp pilus assembly protein FimT